MLHGHDGPRPGKSHPDADLQGHLLIGRPLRLAAQAFKMFEDFGGGSAGIPCTQFHRRITSRRRNCLVTTQEKHLQTPGRPVVNKHPAWLEKLV